MDKKDKLLIPEVPKGFQDRWGYNLFFKKKLLNIIEKNFIKYGYSPLETSPMEYSSIIGNSLAEDDENPMADIYTFEESGKRLSLRYDLSQSCIRFYKQNYMNLPNPFKRYQIGRVYRDGPIKLGRYREFWQCDVDIVGNKNMAADAEMLAIADKAFKKLNLKNPLVVSPDMGGYSRSKKFASLLKTDFIVLKKHRDRKTGRVSIQTAKVDVQGKDLILVDDIISTGGSIIKAAQFLKKQKCKRVFVACTHGLLVEGAEKKIRKAGVSRIISTNTIPGNTSKVDISGILAKSVQ